MTIRMPLAAAVLAMTAAFGAGPAPEGPQIHRLVRTFDWASGFPVTYAGRVEQDGQGFLWVAGPSGLVAFDGARSRVVRHDVAYVALGRARSGNVVVIAEDGTCYAARSGGLERLGGAPPSGRPGRLSVAISGSGEVWRLWDERLDRLDAANAWVPVPLAEPAGEFRALFTGRGDRMFLTGPDRVFEVDRSGTVRPFADVERAISVLVVDDQTTLIAANQPPGPVTTRVFEVGPHGQRLLYEENGARFLGMSVRGDLLWVGTDVALVGLARDGTPLARIVPPAVPALGAPLVDREGSLWMATFRGLVQIPEPEVWAAGGSNVTVTRYMARTPEGVWSSSWGTLAFVSDGRGDPQVRVWAHRHYAAFCDDGAGTMWTGDPDGRLARLDPVAGLQPVPGADRWIPMKCGAGAGGRKWIPTEEGDLYLLTPGEVPRPLRAGPDALPVARPSVAVEDAGGTLWVAGDARLCRADGAALASGGRPEWTCEPDPGIGSIVDLEPMPSGDLWAVTSDPSTVLRRRGGVWEPVPGSARLDSRWPVAIEPSPSGGHWLVGVGILVRFVERADLPDGWELVERPGTWQGLPSNHAVAIAEDHDGTVWLGSDLGVVRWTAAARRTRLAPPPIALVEVLGDAGQLDPDEGLRLSYRRNRLEALFAALSFREPAAVRYRGRLRPGDPWTPPSPDGRFRFVDLRPGRYALEVVASVDGERWSETPSRLEFSVLRPWYASPWFLGGLALALAGSGHLLYRGRVARRIEVERRRARIAMDLHDEVGSGLGTIAVLAGIAGRPDVSPGKRREVASRIESVAQELSRSLGDIVWSLRASSGTLDSFWGQLVDRAHPLFAAGRPALAVEAPEPVPAEPLPLVVRRNLFLLALEALHNAARHAGASTVALRLARGEGHWRLEVEDDGSGIPADGGAPRSRRGLGLEAMRTRAEEMGGSIAWQPREGGGTRVVVRFRVGREGALA